MRELRADHSDQQEQMQTRRMGSRASDYEVYYEDESEEEEVDDYISRINANHSVASGQQKIDYQSDSRKISTSEKPGLKPTSDYEANSIKNGTGRQNSQGHFIGSSFGKNSLPHFNEIMKKQYQNSNYAYEEKSSEEIKLNESNESKQI